MVREPYLIFPLHLSSSSLQPRPLPLGDWRGDGCGGVRPNWKNDGSGVGTVRRDRCRVALGRELTQNDLFPVPTSDSTFLV